MDKSYLIPEPGDRFRVLVPGDTPDVTVGAEYLAKVGRYGAVYFIDDAGERNYAIDPADGVGTEYAAFLLEYPGQIEFIEGVKTNG